MLKKIFVVLFLLVGLVVGAFTVNFMLPMIKGNDAPVTAIVRPQPVDPMAPRYSETATPPQKTVSILFIGSSFISKNDLPGMLLRIASSDKTNTTRFAVSQEIRDGSNLEDQMVASEAYKIIQTKHFDYVVMQETSGWMFSGEHSQRAHRGFSAWIGAMRHSNSRPIIYETWADKACSAFYIPGGAGSEVAQEIVATNIKNIAASYSMGIAPVGGFWNYVTSQPNAPDLYAPDCHHPNVAGTYLASLVFYRYFTGLKPDHVTFVPAGMNPADAAYLRAAAAM
jgi:hypothetical protein